MIAELEDVVVRTADTRLVGPVSWTLERGQRWVVVGPNGAGKSTLLRVVGGWEYPSRGRVQILGARVGATDVRDIRAQVGWVSGHLDRSLAPRSTVHDVMVAGLRGHLRHWGEDVTEHEGRRISDLLALVHCEQLAGRVYKTLSEGERQRVLIGRALLADPPLLLLDEPFAGLDLAGRELLIGTLDQVARQEPDRVVVLVTHHLEDIPSSFTHGLLLRDGVAQERGPLDEVITESAVSECFGLPVRIIKDRGRYATMAARLVRTPTAG